MKKTLLLGIFALFIFVNTGFSQSSDYPIWNGIWTEFQTCGSSVQWLFGKDKEFAKTHLSGSGGLYNAGNYVMDTKSKTITIYYTTHINLTYKKVSTSDGQETLHIVKESQNELIFSRPLRSGEKPNNVSDDKNYYITLTRLTTNHSSATAKND